MNDYRRACGHPGWGGGCDTCWSEAFWDAVADGRCQTLRMLDLLSRLVSQGLDREAADAIAHGWEQEFFGVLDYGLSEGQIEAINAAFRHRKSGGAA